MRALKSGEAVSDGQNMPDFGEVYAAVKRVVEARGVAGESLVTYTEGGAELSRTALNEYRLYSLSPIIFSIC